MRVKILFLISGWCMILPSQTVSAEDAVLWKRWLVTQVEQHPSMVAAQETLNAAQSSAEGARQPLYNPELETELEREGSDDNYRLGLKQTVDWWDKRGALAQKGQFFAQNAEQVYEAMRQQQYSETLTALVQWRIAQKKSVITQQQETQLSQLLEVIQQRQQTGDMSQVDAALAYMALSQRLKSTADAEADLRRAEANLTRLLPTWQQNMTLSSIPDPFWQWHSNNGAEQLSRQHPDVVAADMRWQALKANTVLAQRQQHADPSFGVNVGRQNDENTVGMTFSVPLTVRNNFSAQARAASQEALSAESSFRATYLQRLHLIKGSQAVVSEYEKRYQRWQSLIKSHSTDSSDLLEKQWRTGDLSATDYIQILNQHAEGRIAGIELEQEWKITFIEYLTQSGVIAHAITSP